MAIDIKRIKAICFDVDGTLSDTDDLYTRTLARWLPRAFFRNPAYAARRFVMWAEAPGNALLGIADRAGLDDEMAVVLNWLARRHRRPRRVFLLVPGVDELLQNLYGKYPMAVVSARDETGTMAFLDHFGLAKYFNVIVTGLTARHTKPYPDPILFAAEKMGISPENCLMVGDTTVDIRAGKSAGAQTVGVLCGFGERAELEGIGADVILEDTPKLFDLLQLIVTKNSPQAE